MPVPHAPAIRWASIFEEPFASRASQLQADRLLTEHLAADRYWTAIWAAGALHSVTQTLPSDDPWKRVSAALGVPSAFGPTNPGSSGDGDLDNLLLRKTARPDGTSEVTPMSTGAYLDGKPFGTFANGQDIYDHPMPEPWTDPALVVLTGPSSPDAPMPSGPDGLEPLNPISAALIGFAGAEGVDGFEQLLKVMTVVFDTQQPGTALTLWSDALRWVAWRRRCYTGNEDNFTSGAMLAWASWADSYVVGEWQPANHLRDIKDHLVPTGSYTSWRNYLSDVKENEPLPPEWFEANDVEAPSPLRPVDED